MAAPVVECIETRRDEAWIYGDRFVDGEFICHWVQPNFEESAKKINGYGLALYEVEILLKDHELADYFEAVVFACQHPALIAAWLYCQCEPGVDPKFVSAFVDAVFEHIPTPAQCAKFIINEILAVAKRHKISFLRVPVNFTAILLLYRRAGLIDNKTIKQWCDKELTCQPLSS